MSSKSDLSPNERKLIAAIDPDGYWLTIEARGSIMVPMLLQLLGGVMFVQNRQGPEVEALRRAPGHLARGGYRGNAEYEKLIEF